MTKFIEITEKILKLLIEYTPLDYMLGELNNHEPWKGSCRYYQK